MKSIKVLLAAALAMGAALVPATAEAAVPWVPMPGVQWQWQLSGNPTTAQLRTAYNSGARAFDIDGDGASAATVAAIHALGPGVGAVCYIDAGGWEDYRTDASKFPKSVLGRAIDGWPSERWLDIRQIEILQPLMRARMETCKTKGFDGVEPDLMDGYSNSTGFPLTKAHQLAYNRMLADTAHAVGLSVAQKGAPELSPDLVASFDWVLNEQCGQYRECGPLAAYKNAGKAVWIVEYAKGKWPGLCAQDFPLAGQAAMLKAVDLTPSPRTACMRARG